MFSRFIKIKCNLSCYFANGKSAYLEKNSTIADTRGTRHVDMIMINNEHTRSQGFLC